MGRQVATAHAVIVVVQMSDGRFVFIQESKESCRGLWSLPGGMLEPGEGIFAAGAREVFEEAGVHIRPMGILKIEHLRYVTDVAGEPVEKLRHIVFAEYISGELKDAANLDSQRARALRLDEASRLDLREPACLEWLRMAQSQGSWLPVNCYEFRTI